MQNLKKLKKENILIKKITTFVVNNNTKYSYTYLIYNMYCTSNEIINEEGLAIVCQMLNSSEDCAFIVDNQNKILFANKQAIMFTNTTDSVEGLQIEDIIGNQWQEKQTFNIEKKVPGLTTELYNATINKLTNQKYILRLKKEQTTEYIDQTNFKMLFENMTSGFVFLKAIFNEKEEIIDHEILDVNSTFEILTNYERQDVVGKKISFFFSQDNDWCKKLNRTALTGHTFSGSYTSRKTNKYLEVKSYSPKKGYAAVVFNDAKAQIEMRNELIVKNEISKAFALGNNISIYKIILDIILKYTQGTNGMIGYYTSDYKKFIVTATICPKLDYPQEEDGTMIFDIKEGGLLDSCLKTKTVQIIKESTICGIPTKNILSIPIINDEKLLGMLGVSNAPTTYGNKALIFAKSLGQYISSMVLAEIKDRTYKRELLIAKERAEENERLKSSFLANMSHEVRTPMNSISGFSELLAKSNNLTPKQQNYVNIILKSSKQLLRIVEDIMDVSKLQTQQTKVKNSELDINQLITEIYEEFKPEAEAKKLELILTKGLQDKDATIVSDKYKLRKIIVALTSNAIKFTNKGIVSLSYIIDKENIKFTISDTGIGIRKELHEGIFTSFRQAENILERKYNGVGLGLTISKGFLNLMGGNIWLESEPEKGSKFHFTIKYQKALSE